MAGHLFRKEFSEGSIPSSGSKFQRSGRDLGVASGCNPECPSDKSWFESSPLHQVFLMTPNGKAHLV